MRWFLYARTCYVKWWNLSVTCSKSRRCESENKMLRWYYNQTSLHINKHKRARRHAQIKILVKDERAEQRHAWRQDGFGMMTDRFFCYLKEKLVRVLQGEEAHVSPKPRTEFRGFQRSLGKAAQGTQGLHEHHTTGIDCCLEQVFQRVSTRKWIIALQSMK